jgi:hypothetical protein
MKRLNYKPIDKFDFNVSKQEFKVFGFIKLANFV